MRVARLDIVPGRAFEAGRSGGDADVERTEHRETLSGGVGGACGTKVGGGWLAALRKTGLELFGSSYGGL